MSALTGRPILLLDRLQRPSHPGNARARPTPPNKKSIPEQARERGFSRFRAVEKATLEETGTDGRRRDKTVLLLLRKTGSPVRIGDLAVEGCVNFLVLETGNPSIKLPPSLPRSRTRNPTLSFWSFWTFGVVVKCRQWRLLLNFSRR